MIARYLPALVVCLLATSVLSVYPQALLGIALAFYLALRDPPDKRKIT